MAQLRHGPGLDLADPLPGQVEMLPDLFEGTGLTSIEPEAQPENFPLSCFPSLWERS